MNKWVVAIFDTSTRVDNVMAVILREVEEDFTIDEYLSALEKYNSCKTGEQYGSSVHSVLQKYEIYKGNLSFTYMYLYL